MEIQSNYENYLMDNEQYVQWFESFKIEFTEKFPEFQNKVELTGSRSFKLAYPESDLEFAIIVLKEQQEEVFDKVSNYFKERCGEIKLMKTKAGLFLITIDNFAKDPNVWKLEITLRTDEQQKTICDPIRCYLENI